MGSRSHAKLGLQRLLLGALFALFALSLANNAIASCAPDRVQLRGDWGSAAFNVEVADTVASRNQGLMHRETMPMSAGMIFVYPQPQRAAFWMRNTLIPLDMLFADATGVVTRIHANAIPLDETPIVGGDEVQFVLEINGGLAARIGITEGSQMRHPTIDAKIAAWPCTSD